MILREARLEDCEALAALLNAVIRRGGTTAFEEPFDAGRFREAFLDGPDALLLLVADEGGTLLGFQSLGRHPELPADWADIATFARPEPKVPGVGTALFGETRRRAAALGVRTIHAQIRADNGGGLGFYERMGFRPWRVLPAVPLRDGTPVDRIAKRLDLEAAAAPSR